MIQTYDMTKFGEELKLIRKRLNLSQKQTNTLTGVNRDTIRRIEQGLVIPTFDTILKLSTVYHQDLISLFTEHAYNHGLTMYYEEIDLAILYGVFDDIGLIKDAITKRITEDQSLNITVDPIELKQFILYYEVLYLIHDDDVGHQSKIVSLVKDILSLRHEDYDLKNYDKYHYTFIEQRTLFTYSTIIESFDRPKCITLLEFLYSRHTSINGQSTILFRLKILLNLMINYHEIENDYKTLALANTGISLAQMHHVTYYLGEFYIYKGLAQYFLKEGDYTANFKCGYYTYKATGFEERLKELIGGIKQSCDIDMEKF